MHYRVGATTVAGSSGGEPMADHSIEALLVRVADLEHRLEASKAAPMPRPSKRRRTALVAGLLAVALLVPVGVFA